MNTNQMLSKLQYSRNELTASVARNICEGYMTIKEAKQRNYGHFMTAVLQGNYDDALCYADDDNRRCIAEEYEIETEQYLEL